MRILTDKLRSNLKVQTVSNRQVLGYAVLQMIYWRVWPAECTACLLLFRSLHRTDSERGDTAPGVRARAHGAVLETSFNWMIAKVFFKKYPLWKKAAKRVRNLLNRVMKSHLCVRCGSWWQRALGICGGRCGYYGGPPQINQHVGNTGPAVNDLSVMDCMTSPVDKKKICD